VVVAAEDCKLEFGGFGTRIAGPRIVFADDAGIMIGTLMYGIIASQTWTFFMAAKAGSHTLFDRWIAGLINLFQCVRPSCRADSCRAICFVAAMRCGYWLLIVRLGLEQALTAQIRAGIPASMCVGGRRTRLTLQA